MNSQGINSNKINNMGRNATPSSIRDDFSTGNKPDRNSNLVAPSNYKIGRKRVFFGLLIGYK